MGGSTSAQIPQTSEKNNNKSDVIVIPVDQSPNAENAFNWYMKHVHKPDNQVWIVHCLELPSSGPYFPEQTFKSESFQHALSNMKQTSDQICAKYQKLMEDNNINGMVFRESGNPGQVVLNAATQKQATMIVMGTRGLGLVRRTVLGSVSEYVLNHTNIPLTVVPNTPTSETKAAKSWLSGWW